MNNVIKFRVFASSPGDVDDEKNALQEAVKNINLIDGEQLLLSGQGEGLTFPAFSPSRYLSEMQSNQMQIHTKTPRHQGSAGNDLALALAFFRS